MLQLKAISKTYDKNFSVNVDFEIEHNTFVSILGPSGCGKTTLLRIIAGLEKPDSGKILLDGHDMTKVKPGQRKIGLVFQDYALFPHLSVRKNIEYGLGMMKLSSEERAEKVNHALELVELAGMNDRDIATLSGGEKQRVAIARSLVLEPDILLLDEPFSALDQNIRGMLRREIRHLQRRLGISIVFVTHNQEEALSLSDQIIVMQNGKIEQIGSPEEVYYQPKTRYISEFVGDANLIDCTVESTYLADRRLKVVYDSANTITVRFTSAWDTVACGQKVTVMFRPEDTELHCGDKCPAQLIPADNTVVVNGVIGDVEFMGPFTFYRIDSKENRFKCLVSGGPSFTLGSDIQMVIPGNKCIAVHE